LPLAFTIADVFDLTIEEIFLPDRADTTNDPARS
jgi:putative transcriptional regulator